ncbi:MAG: MFS transporter [Candidatus Heimdallarchaeota archaeon]|nr:MFS transporter [Candidatus Heimdallarchaeota archaeon]
MNQEIKPSTNSLRQYWLFFTGQLLSILGSNVVQFSLIWWLTLTATEDPRYADKTATILGLASVAGFAPFIITIMFSGVLIDRWNRKKVIIISDGMQAVFTGIMMLMFYYKVMDIPYYLILLALRGIANGFHNPAIQAIIPLMVPRDKRTKVNSLEYLFNGVIGLIGPAIGAYLLFLFGIKNIATLLWIDIITFLIAIIPVLKIHIPDITKEKRESKEKKSFKTEFKEGISFIQKQDGLLSLLITFTAINILVTPVFMLLPLIVVDPDLLNSDIKLFATLLIAVQVGSILGPAILSVKPNLLGSNPRGVAVGQGVIYLSIYLLIYGIVINNFWILIISMILFGFGGPFANIPSQTIWQSVVPAELQGRVMTVRQLIAWTMIPVSQLIGGILADLFGVIWLFSVSLIIGVLFLIYAWFMTAFPNVEKKLGIDNKNDLISEMDSSIEESGSNPVV